VNTSVKPDADQVPPFRTIRQARGLSLHDVAQRAGIHPAQLSRVERGQAGLSVPALHRLAGVLGLRELEQLLALCIAVRAS
jgi:transcriptional regulator with XRE-family HTH domain